jgi:hypothetical protein
MVSVLFSQQQVRRILATRVQLVVAGALQEHRVGVLHLIAELLGRKKNAAVRGVADLAQVLVEPYLFNAFAATAPGTMESAVAPILNALAAPVLADIAVKTGSVPPSVTVITKARGSSILDACKKMSATNAAFAMKTCPRTLAKRVKQVHAGVSDASLITNAIKMEAAAL